MKINELEWKFKADEFLTWGKLIKYIILVFLNNIIKCNLRQNLYIYSHNDINQAVTWHWIDLNLVLNSTISYNISIHET